ncbi:amyloid protein-binding protein 2-like [Anopheles bellator]|uniref:amyloid protein-binding protein 2-like n=1 Tax=Anopheles bellator TaxID=139047 RepID=UPI0026487603|nr:amyloid protein-binding protein 2-like [Anopheles bellator]
MGDVARYWPLCDPHLDTRQAAPRNPPLLQRLALEALVRAFSRSPRCRRLRAVVEQLPLFMRLDAIEDMCDYRSLLDVQLDLLSDPLLVSDVIRRLPGERTKLIRCLQWLESNKKQLIAQLCRRYMALYEADRIEAAAGVDCWVGQRIGVFLIETGWLQEGATILHIARLQTTPGSDEEVAVSLHLLRAQTLGGSLIDARQSYDRITAWMMSASSAAYRRSLVKDSPNGQEATHDLAAAVHLALSLYQLEVCEVSLSYHYAVLALELLSESASHRLVIDVCRQLARACLARQFFAKANHLLRQAIARAGEWFGKQSAQYAETLEDYAMYLLARDNVTECVNVFSEAQQIYLRLYGSRNLLLAHAQGNIVFGLCLQAYVICTDQDQAMHHVEKTMANFGRILPAGHRLLVQGRRLRTTMGLLLFGLNAARSSGWTRQSEEHGQDTERVEKLNEKERALPVGALRRGFYLC